MDEEKLKKIKAKIAYFRKIGQNQKADQLENKIIKADAKKELREEVGPTKVGGAIQKIKKVFKKPTKDEEENEKK